MLLARSYSHHSLLSAVPKIGALVSDAKAKGYTAIALTDEETGSGFVEFYEACQKAEIKPVLGTTLRIPNISKSASDFSKRSSMSKVALLAKNESGYRELLRLISVARTEREDPAYHILLQDFKAEVFSEELFALICGNDHEVGALLRSEKEEQVEMVLQTYAETIGVKNILVELLLPIHDESEAFVRDLNKKLISICGKIGIQVIASPAPRYLENEDEEAFRTVLAVRNGKRLSGITLERDFSLPSVAELQSKFGQFKDVCDTQNIEDQINIEVRFDYDVHAAEAFFPKFALPEGQNPEGRLRWDTYIGLILRLHEKRQSRAQWKEEFPYEKLDVLIETVKSMNPEEAGLPGYPTGYFENTNTIDDYVHRVEHELDVIITKGYTEYFLVFGDIMQFCRDSEIVINTRGSAAGCIVGYLNDINILDPLLYQLPFERFLNPFRPSPPDIDGDFADNKRHLVIEYITKQYGADHVCQIITFGTMLPRAAVRDVGRVLGISYNKCDRLSKLIPNAPQGKKTTFDWAFEMSAELTEVFQRDDECRRIIEISRKIEGNYRHASVHAAGVIITPVPVHKLAPLQWDSDHQMIICQYDMRNVEKAGLIKLDILGIRNLAILGNAVELAQERTQTKIDLLNIDITDAKTFDILAKGRTIGTFQLSGAAMTKYLVELGPTKVQDLMAMVALYRPGPMGSIPEYIKRKKKPKLVKYIVPQMKDWMAPSYGIFVYQEDLLFTAIELAGYNWGEVDKLRKGMGKKIQKVIDEQRPKFVNGCVEKSGLTKEKAEEIWSLMVPFGAYGFNKSHSSSYGMVAYWTAYMKANYPAEFMTALMTAESNNLDKIARAIQECAELGIKVMPPDVNVSFDSFSIEDNTTIRYGLSSVKNLGSDVIANMIEEREKNGSFSSIDDFLDRMSTFSGFNKRSLEALIWSGCLDSVGSLVAKHRTIEPA